MQAEQKAKEAAEQAAQSGDHQTAAIKLYEAQELAREAASWESGGENKRKATVIATALSLAVAGKPAEAIAAGAASPYINEAIKHITENKALEALNIPLHILWGAVEAELAGGSARTGAIAAGVGEIGAAVLANTVYGKSPSQLNDEEKQTLINASKALAGAATAISTAASGSNGATLLAEASVGMTVAENAVESNYLSDWQKAQKAKELKECNGNWGCETRIGIHWTAVDLGQDASFASGIAAGVPASLLESVAGIVEMALSPVETFNAIKTMVMQDDAFSHFTDAVKQSYAERIETLKSEYEKAGLSGSFKAGLEMGGLLSEMVGVAAGGVGVAKVSATVLTKGIKKSVKIIAKNPSGKFKDDLNIGKNRADFNEGLNVSISERSKDLYLNKYADEYVKDMSSKIDFDSHIFNTEINKRGNLTGGHSIANGNINIIEIGKMDDLGVYEAKISFLHPRTGKELIKDSTMFPDAWSANRVKYEVDSAYKNRTEFKNDKGRMMWKGTTPSGVNVQGFLEPNLTVYPLMQ